jgi:hypothetical protein
MAAFTSQSMTRFRVSAWGAPAGALCAGVAAAALFLLLPQTALEDWVWQSGLPGLIAVAEPPLGTTARAVLALGAATLAAAVTWSALFLLIGPDGVFAPRPAAEEGVPVLRRADAHPDAPARKPMSAADLGAPFPPPQDYPDVEVTVPADVAAVPPAPPPPPVMQPIPDDLDMPLAAFHPGAVPDVPREPVRPVASLRPGALEIGERIETVELPCAPTESASAPSIESLLRRLEQSTRRPLRA